MKGRIFMKNFKRKVGNILEIPREITSNVPKVTITAFDELIVENFKGILEYENFFVRISTYIGNININGFNLKLTQMNEDDILIQGKIEGIDFENEESIG